MLIVGEEILDQKLLNGADKSHIKNSSYYLTIGALIPVGEEAKDFDFDNPAQMLVIKPGQVAWVVSKEVFNIKSHEITALVTLRSTFTKQGLLALDVGMVDPDFEGPIGSIVINFSKNEVSLQTGEEFFRVAFMKHPEVPVQFRPNRERFSAAHYIKQRHKEIISSFPATFLNTESLTAAMIRELSEKRQADILDGAILHIAKNHWGKLATALLAVAALSAVLVYFAYSNFGPKLSREDVQQIFQNLIEKNLLPQKKS